MATGAASWLTRETSACGWVGPIQAGALFLSLCLPSIVRWLLPNGTVARAAGNGKSGYSGDNGPATAGQMRPLWVAAYPGTALFGRGFLVAERSNSVIRRAALPAPSQTPTASVTATPTQSQRPYSMSFALPGGGSPPVQLSAAAPPLALGLRVDRCPDPSEGLQLYCGSDLPWATLQVRAMLLLA